MLCLIQHFWDKK